MLYRFIAELTLTLKLGLKGSRFRVQRFRVPGATVATKNRIIIVDQDSGYPNNRFEY
ncbi:hypothetical protein D1AOALGA4SA_6693 [Olavius algarvensis Delta 1 endosymbiont]|nr:hypothetical protein D1AOALGA4SA_6693 [Olavius algarvensis Delta 1 endosymbiont]